MAKAALKSMRAPANASHRFANSAVSISAAPTASRINLRANEEGVASFSKGLGFDLPGEPHTTAHKAGKAAMWLGPDEWLIIDEKNPDTSLVPKLPNRNFSAVDISHRNTAYVLEGPGAENTLNVACPRDLSLAAFLVGTCSRTIFGKAEVVIWRQAEQMFRLECWRSFTPYVWQYLLEGAKDAHI